MNKSNKHKIEFKVFKRTLHELTLTDKEELSKKQIAEIKSNVKDYLSENLECVNFADLKNFLLCQSEKSRILHYRLAKFCEESQLMIWDLIGKSESGKIRYDRNSNVIDSQIWFFQNSNFFTSVPNEAIMRKLLDKDINTLFTTQTDEGSLICSLFYFKNDLRYLLDYKDAINKQTESFKKDFVRFMSGIGLNIVITKNNYIALKLLFSVENWYTYNEKAVDNLFRYIGNCAGQTHRKETETLFFRNLSHDFFIYMNKEKINLAERLVEATYLPSERIIKKCEQYQSIDTQSWDKIFQFLKKGNLESLIRNKKLETLFQNLIGINFDLYLKIRKTYVFNELFHSQKKLSQDLFDQIRIEHEKILLNKAVKSNLIPMLPKQRI